MVTGKDIRRQINSGDMSQVERTVGIRPGDTDENSLAHACIRKFGITGLEKGQYPLTLLFFVVGITLLQATINAVAPCFTLFIFDAALLIDGQVAVGVGDGFPAPITFNFA
jgi:hypothetical protein